MLTPVVTPTSPRGPWFVQALIIAHVLKLSVHIAQLVGGVEPARISEGPGKDGKVGSRLDDQIWKIPLENS